MKTQISFYKKEIKNVAAKGFFYLFTAQGFIIIIGFASQFFVAKFIDPTDIGRIKIMQTYMNLAVLLCGLGFNIALLKMASEDIDFGERKRLYQAAFLMTLVSFVFIYLLLYLFSDLGLISSDPVISKAFPLYLLFLLPLAMQSIQVAYYQATMKIKRLAKLQFIIKTIAILFIVFFTNLFKLNGYIITIVITGFITFIIFEIDIKNLNFSREYFKLDLELIKKMWRFAGYAMLANIVGIIVTTMDVYIINYLIHERKEVGFYMFALTVISVYQILPVTIQQVALPFFSQQSSRHEKWHESYVKYNKLNHILIIVVVIGGILLMPFFIKLFFSGKYDRSIYYFIFLSIAWMIKSSSLIKSTAIIGYGRFDINFITSLVILLFSFPIVFVLIKLYGLNGALAGMILSSVINYLTVDYNFKRFNKSLIRGF